MCAHAHTLAVLWGFFLIYLFRLKKKKGTKTLQHKPKAPFEKPPVISNVFLNLSIPFRQNSCPTLCWAGAIQLFLCD